MEPTPRLKQLVLQLYNPSSTLWILDGYDEIVGREPPQVKEALGEMLTAPNRILTGRPQAMSAVPSDFQVEVAGFNDRDVLDFVNRFTGTEVHAPQVRSHSQNSIVSKLRNNRVLWQLAHVPVNLILLCHVLKDSFYVANMSLTGVYTRIEWLMMLRSQDRELAAVEDSGADVTPMLPMMRVLSDVAMEAAMAGVVVIPGSAVEKCFSEREGVGWPQLLACGMLTQADVSSLTPDVAQFFFLHLTLQEYYAAKGVIGACMHQNVTVLDWLRRNKYASHLEMVWVFAAGLLSQLCSDSNAALEALNVFAQLWLDPPRDIGKQQETRLWMRMCEEGRLWQFTDASPSVLTLITQLDSRVRIACVSMLSGASPSTRFGWFGTFRDCPMYLNRCVSVMEDLPSLLCSAMTHDAPDVRRVSIQLVGWLGLEVLQLREIVTALLRTIDSDNHQLRLVGIQCLLGFGSAAVLRDPVLVEWIRAHFASDRRDVAQAIADLVLGLNEDVFDLDSDWIIQCVMSELENARLHSLAVSVLKGLHHCLYTFEPVTTWLRSCVELDDHRHFDTACDILVAMGPTLIHVPWASNWVLQSLPTHSEPHIRVLASIGVQCLHSVEFDWVRPWLKQVMASGDVREWKLAMPVIITVSSSLLQFDWFVQWLLRALSTLETSSEVVAVVQSLGHLVIQHQSIVTSLFSLLKHSSRIAAPTLHTLSDLGVDVVALGFSPLVLLSLVRATDTRLEALKVASLVDCRRWKGVDLRPTVMTCLDRLNEPPILSATFHWLSVLRWEDTAQPLILELLTDITTSLGDSSSALILSLLSSFGSRLAASEEFVVLLQRFLSSKDADVARAAALCVVRMDGTAMKYDALVSWMERLVSGARPDVSSCCFVIQLLRMYGLASIQQRPRLCALLFALLQDDRKETVLSLLNDLFPHVSLSNDELLNWFLRHVVSADVAIRTAAYNSLRSMVLLHNHSLPEQALPPAALAFLAHSNAISLDIHREWGSVLQLDSTAGRCTLTVSEEAFAVLRDLDFDSIQLPAVDLSPVEACCASITSLLDIGDESTAVIADALRRFQWEDRVHVTAWQHVKELCSRMVPRLDVVDKLLDLVLDSMRSLVTNVVVQTACCELLLGIPTLKPRWPLRQALQEQLLIALQEHVGDERLRKPALSLLVRAGQDLNKLASDAGILLVIQAVDALCSEAPPAFLTERVALKGGISLVLEAISTASDDLCCLEACVHILYMFTTVPSTTQPGTAPGDVSVSLLENPQFWTALATARDKLPPGHKDQLRITATIRNALHPIVSSLCVCLVEPSDVFLLHARGRAVVCRLLYPPLRKLKR